MLSACTTSPIWSDVVGSAYSGKYSASHDPTALAPINPAFRYLRVEVSHSPAALLVLGYVDAHPDGPVEVWYSSKGEVIRLQNGRVVGTAGLAFDWTRVWFDVLPSWQSVPPSGLNMTRWHDEKKGYIAGTQQRLQLQAVSPPTAWPSKLPKLMVSDYLWFQETDLGVAADKLPPSVYALGTYRGQRRIVYSEQCLSFELCLKLQLWPPQAEKL